MRFRSSQIRPRTLPMDITALVDVVFLLIIFFLTTSSLVEITRERIELPQEKGESERQTSTPGLIVNVTQSGELIVERKRVTHAQLLAMVRAEIEKAEDDPSRVDLLIRADRTSPLASVNEIAEGLVGLGVRNWRLGTQVPFGGSGLEGGQ